MGSKSILQIVNEARVGTSLPRVTSLFSADSRKTRTVEIAELAILETVEDFLDHAWGALETQATITTVSGTEAYALPSDFHELLTETYWLTSAKLPGFGPVSKADWRYFKNWGIGGTMYPRWRVQGGYIYIYPTPTADGQTHQFDYISKNLVYGVGGYQWGSFSWGLGQWTAAETSAGYKEAFTKNEDTFKLDDAVLRKGIRWRLLRDSGMPYAVEERDYRTQMDRLISADKGGPPNIQVGRRMTSAPPIFSTIGQET